MRFVKSSWLAAAAVAVAAWAPPTRAWPVTQVSSDDFWRQTCQGGKFFCVIVPHAKTSSGYEDYGTSRVTCENSASQGLQRVGDTLFYAFSAGDVAYCGLPKLVGGDGQGNWYSSMVVVALQRSRPGVRVFGKKLQVSARQQQPLPDQGFFGWWSSPSQTVVLASPANRVSDLSDLHPSIVEIDFYTDSTDDDPFSGDNGGGTRGWQVCRGGTCWSFGRGGFGGCANGDFACYRDQWARWWSKKLTTPPPANPVPLDPWR